MEVCREVMDGLLLLKRSTLSDQHMRTILSECRQLVLNEDMSDETREQTIDDRVLRLAICSLVIELAKHNSGAEAMEAVLEECGLRSADKKWVNSNCLLLVDFYRNIRPQVRDVLTSTESFATDLPHVVDIDWDQMLVLESADRQKVNEIEYLINISCEPSVGSSGARRTITTTTTTTTTTSSTDDNSSADLVFSASLPQLQDLCHKLRECRRVVEKIIK